MFRTNDDHRQFKLFSHYREMKPGIAKMLENTWASVFYKEVFCKINEELFAPLYCNDNGRPNFPVNILLSLEIIKHLFDYNDKEILEQFYFNFQVLYALGIHNIGEVYVAERTIYEFRERIFNYIKEHPDQEDILFQQFEALTKNFIAITGIKTDELRTDSTFISPNIKKAGRLSLAHDVLLQAVKALPSELLSPGLKQVLDKSFRTELLYHTRNNALESRFQKVIELMAEVAELTKNRPDIASLEAINILNRFLAEQTRYNEEEKRLVAKESKEIKSDSLQSAYDTDATYRDKAGRKQSGYSLNLTETCAEENAVQLITDYKLEPNNKSDVKIIDSRLEIIKKNTDVKDLYNDGGYYSEKVIEKAKSLDINIHYTNMTGKNSADDRLPLTEFGFNKKLEVTHCPNGKKLIQSCYNTKTKISTSHFDKKDCEGCPLRANCHIKEQKKTMVLRVNKKSILAADVRAQINTAGIRRQNISKRAAIEGTNSCLKRSQGAGKLRVRGIIKCNMQIAFKVIGHNFKQTFQALKKLVPKPCKGVACQNAS